jgi:hypothetical protein
MSKSDEAKAREHRLAAKLRENLKRRKGLAGTKGAGAAADRKPVGGAQGNDDKS